MTLLNWPENSYGSYFVVINADVRMFITYILLLNPQNKHPLTNIKVQTSHIPVLFSARVLAMPKVSKAKSSSKSKANALPVDNVNVPASLSNVSVQHPNASLPQPNASEQQPNASSPQQSVSS